MSRPLRTAALAIAAAVPACAFAFAAEYAASICSTLASTHVSGSALEGDLSRRAWTNSIESLDSSRMVFLADDLDFLEPYGERIGADVEKGDFSFALAARTIYRKRLFECVRYATNLLEKADFKFDGGEFRPDRSGGRWPADVAEREAVWRGMLANEALEEYLDCETGGVKAACKKVADDLLEEYRIEIETGREMILEEFLESIVASYDAHTAYFSKEAYRMFRSEMSLELCGIGAQWQLKDGEAKITRVIPGGPLDKAGGVKAGDRIVAVSPDGESKPVKLSGRTQNEISAMFSGERGTRLAIEVRRADGTLKRYDLERDIIPLDDLRAYSRVENVDSSGRLVKTGYLRLDTFYGGEAGHSGTRTCSEDVAAELEKFRSAGVEGVLFDLRGNPGGSLEDAVKIIGLFVEGGPAVRMKGRGPDVSLPVPEAPPLCDKPLVVLVDMGSASAGELVPATLQDLGRAVIAGDRRTFGKGSAQTVVEFEDGEEGAVIATQGRFYRITGSSTQFKGVAADVTLPSLCDDSAYTGEEGLKFPLPWNSIEGERFEPAWDLRKFAPELARRSVKRLADRKDWNEHLDAVAWAKSTARGRVLPLDVAGRKILREKDAQIDARLERQSVLFDVENRGERKPGEDIVLDEAMQVLCDLVELNAGRTLPRRIRSEAAPSSLLDGIDDD